MFSTDDVQLLGYFTLAVKPIIVNDYSFSNTARKKISRIGFFNESEHTFSLAAYLIAQLGKNYNFGMDKRITGDELLSLAMVQIEKIQYQAGGVVVFLEAEDNKKLISFYERNGFRPFDKRVIEKKDAQGRELVQLLRLL